MAEKVASELDPATFEVIDNRLLNIAEEIGIQYMRCSGSNVLITGNDAATAIMTAEGSLVAVGPYIVTQGNVLPRIVDSTVRSIGESEGIDDGDVFICNDPYLGALHQPDMATVMPIFVNGEIFSWIGASGHQLDTGGTDPGGFSIKAVNVHQEGLRMPPVKLVEKAVLREDLLRWILNQVRDPLVGLDIRGQLAALNVGRRRFLELIDRWGADTLRAVMIRSIGESREKLRNRLRQLPDGMWRDVQYIDHDGHQDDIYKIICNMTKKDDHLTFDFAGTSSNAQGLINCTYAGLEAGVLTAVYINLGWDIAWNRGVKDCLRIVSDLGTVNNCQYPAPCAMATISAVIVTIDVVWRCLARMMLASEGLRREVTAVWSGTSMAPIFSGTSQHGHSFAATEMSHFGGGGGARTYRDGVDTAGIVFNTTPNMPNIEDQESEYPVLYLFRRHLRDSGGPGLYRGGRSGELAYTVYDAPEGKLEGLFAGTGAEMPNAIGLVGGFPGSSIRVARVTETDVENRLSSGVHLPGQLGDIEGKLEILCCKHEHSVINSGDVWYHSWQGGGGYGDPLERNPETVAEDVARDAVSLSSAADIYGVVLSGSGEHDLAATHRRREKIRKARLDESTGLVTGDSTITFLGSGVLEFGGVLNIDFAADKISCGYCKRAHCRPGDNLLTHLREVNSSLSAAGPVRGEDYDRGRFHLRQLICPECGGMVDVEVAFEGAPRSLTKIGIEGT